MDELLSAIDDNDILEIEKILEIRKSLSKKPIMVWDGSKSIDYLEYASMKATLEAFKLIWNFAIKTRLRGPFNQCNYYDEFRIFSTFVESSEGMPSELAERKSTRCALYCAYRSGNKRILSFLIDEINKFDPERPPYTPFITSHRMGILNCAKLAIDEGNIEDFCYFISLMGDRIVEFSIESTFNKILRANSESLLRAFLDTIHKVKDNYYQKNLHIMIRESVYYEEKIFDIIFPYCSYLQITRAFIYSLNNDRFKVIDRLTPYIDMNQKFGSYPNVFFLARSVKAFDILINNFSGDGKIFEDITSDGRNLFMFYLCEGYFELALKIIPFSDTKLVDNYGRDAQGIIDKYFKPNRDLPDYMNRKKSKSVIEIENLLKL